MRTRERDIRHAAYQVSPAQSHELRFFLTNHAQKVENDYFVGTQNSISRSTRERDA